MNPEAPPIVVLAGSDRRPADLPVSGRDKHALGGYKGVRVRIEGRPLVEVLIERLRQSRVFGSIWLAGPRRVYARMARPDRTIDTDGGFGENLEAAVRAVRADHPEQSIAFITCDVLPDVATLREAMGDWEGHAPCDLWFPLVRSPADPRRLGASAWKPAYRIVPHHGGPAEAVLPGHLVVVDPRALRLEFVFRLLQIGYSTRNRSIRRRRGTMVRHVLAALLREDLRAVLRAHPPLTTWTVLSAGLSAARRLEAGRLGVGRLEDALRRMFVEREHRLAMPARRVVVSIGDWLPLALDIDTEEEARQIGASVLDADGPSSRRNVSS